MTSDNTMHNATYLEFPKIMGAFQSQEKQILNFFRRFQVQPYNFLSMPLTLSNIDPDLVNLETSLMASIGSLTPNVDLLKMMMEKVFDRPRNRVTHEANR